MAFRLAPPPRVADPVLYRWLQDLYRYAGGEAAPTVTKADFDANTILKADTDNSPEALTVGEATIVGRQTGGVISALTATQGRTLLGLGALATGDTGDDVPVSGFTGNLAGATDAQAALDAVDAATFGGGGLELQASDTADGTAEFLQVTATSTPSSIKRMVCFFRSLVPEVNGDTLNVTVILDDDTELTTASYYAAFWQENAADFTEGNASGISQLFATGNVGNDTQEYVSVRIELVSANGSQDTKHLISNRVKTDSTTVENTVQWSNWVYTTNSIKGFRIDSDNTGDMINEGRAELWVQT